MTETRRVKGDPRLGFYRDELEGETCIECRAQATIAYHDNDGLCFYCDAHDPQVLTLVDREKSNGQSQWIVARRPYFLSNHDDGIELWRSHRPYAANEKVHKFSAGHTPTLEDIDRAIYGKAI